MHSVMVALPCTTDAKLLRQYAKIFVTVAPGVGWGLGASLNDTIKLADPENPHFGTRIWNLSPIKLSYS